jgi:hypothetical protein
MILTLWHHKKFNVVSGVTKKPKPTATGFVDWNTTAINALTDIGLIIDLSQWMEQKPGRLLLPFMRNLPMLIVLLLNTSSTDISTRLISPYKTIFWLSPFLLHFSTLFLAPSCH